MASRIDTSWYEGRNVVVTGAYGYLGSGLCVKLGEAGAKLRRVTRGRPGLEGDPKAWTGDLCDMNFCRRLVEGADVVFHLAGQTSTHAAAKEPFADLMANVTTTLTLLQACGETRHQPAFVYGGTATQIGITHSLTPIPASTPDRPNTVYDANKLAAEQLVGVYTDNGAVAGVTLRIANVFGPGAAKSAPDRGITNKFVALALNGHPLTYYGDGTALRDYVFVDDLHEAFFRAPMFVKHAKERSYVVAGGKGYSLRETLEIISDVVHSIGYPRVGVTSLPWPEALLPIDRRSFVADINPIEQWLHWRPTTTFREGLRITAGSLSKQISLPHSSCVL